MRPNPAPKYGLSERDESSSFIGIAGRDYAISGECCKRVPWGMPLFSSCAAVGRCMLCILGEGGRGRAMCIYIAQACVGYLMQVMYVYVCLCHMNLANMAYYSKLYQFIAGYYTYSHRVSHADSTLLSHSSCHDKRVCSHPYCCVCSGHTSLLLCV